MYTLKETAEMFGGSYDEKWQADDKQLLETFERDGFEFLGCVLVKEELAKALAEANVYWDMAYVVRGVLGYGGRTKKSTYLVTDVWDMSHGRVKLEHTGGTYLVLAVLSTTKHKGHTKRL